MFFNVIIINNNFVNATYQMIVEYVKKIFKCGRSEDQTSRIIHILNVLV